MNRSKRLQLISAGLFATAVATAWQDNWLLIPIGLTGLLVTWLSAEVIDEVIGE